jgi:hypothetical protein
MSTEPLKPETALDTLRAALTQLRALSALPSADPFYGHAAEQVEAIVAELESRTTPTASPSPGVDPPSKGLDPVPPNPG